MQKRIFALWGISNVGKTSTLKLIAREIMRQFFGAISNVPIEPLPNGDIAVIITIDNIKIGIISQGDPNTDLLLRLDELEKKNCDIIFCATRTSGTTVECVEQIEKKYNYKTTWITNYQSGYADERDHLNQHSAESIVGLMRWICKF